MARQPRLDLPGVPQHVVQRGNNRLPCFLDDQDRLRYLTFLREALLATECRLHAYVLMDNHVHLLLSPPAAGATGKLMQKLGRQYVGQFNARHRRTGTLWEGRYKACLIDSESYVLRCARYIDLNPVRARMTDDPSAYRWSSCAALCGQREDPLRRLHPAQLRSAHQEPSAVAPTATCWIKPFPMRSCDPSAPTCNSSEPGVTTTSKAWSKPRPVVSQASDRHTDHPNPSQRSEPDPVFDQENKATGRSFGIVRPDPGSVKFFTKPIAQTNAQDQALNASLFQQNALFEDPLKPLQKAECAFGYRFTSGGHEHAYRRKYGDQALAKLQQEYGQNIPTRHPHFIMGTMKAHPQTFIIIGVLRSGIDPADLDRQGGLF